MVLECTMPTPEKKGNHQYHPAANPKTSKSDLSAIDTGVTVAQTFGSNQLLSDWT